MVSKTRVTPPSSPIAILTGTTASGKTSVALEFCRIHQNVEIINADSLLIYREMDIGTAKPTRSELSEIPHHLIDLKNPDENYTAGDFVRNVDLAIQDIHARGKRALIVGGSGFYLKALLFGMWDSEKSDPKLREALEEIETKPLFEELLKIDSDFAWKIGPNDRYRILRAVETFSMTGKKPSDLEIESKREPIPGFSLLILDRDSNELDQRIRLRVEEMIDRGLIKEVESLLLKYPNARSLDSVGYAETVAYLQNKKPEGRKILPGIPGLVDEITLSTRQLVKRQRTWFNGQFIRPLPELAHRYILDVDRSKLDQELKSVYSRSTP